MSNKIIHATQDWTNDKITELVNSAPEELDTLGEIAEELDKKIDEIELEEILSNNQPGKDNIIKAYAYRISSVTLLSADEVAEYGIAANADVNYGSYILQVEAPSSLVNIEYSVQISQSFYCVGKILAVDGESVIVENIPVDENGVVIGLDKNNDNEATGNIRNVLIITGHPELGDTLIGYFTNANGLMNNTYSRNTFASGQQNNTIGQSSVAFGWDNKTGYMAFAAGAQNKALGQYSFIAGGHNNTIENGAQSGYAEGNGNTIKANHGHAEGNLNTVHPGAQSGHVEGDANGVFGYASHAGGASTRAYGDYSFAHGFNVGAYGRDSAVFGRYNNPGSWNNDENNVGTYAFTVGNGKNNDNRSNALTIDWHGGIQSGQNCVGHSYGYKIKAVSNILTEEELTEAGITPTEGIVYGYYTIDTYDANSKKDILVGQDYSVQIKKSKVSAGKIVKIDGLKIYVDNFPLKDDGTPLGLNADPDIITDGDINNYIMINNYPQYGDTLIGYFTTAFGQNSYAFSRTAEASGRDTRAIGKYSHTHGRGTIAGYAATAFGNKSKALGDHSTAEGEGTKASGTNSHAQNSATVASGKDSTATGNTTKASGSASFAMGLGSSANGDNSLAGGYTARAEGVNSLAFGNAIIVKGDNRVGFGRYNNWRNNSLFCVGNGTSDTNRNNALALDIEGNLEVQTSVKVPLVKANSVVLVAPDGKEYTIAVDDKGTLVAKPVTTE